MENSLHQIEVLYAFISQGPEGEGVMAASLPIDGQMMMMPLVGSDLKRVKIMLPIARQIALAVGQTFKVYRFENKVDVSEEIELYSE